MKSQGNIVEPYQMSGFKLSFDIFLGATSACMIYIFTNEFFFTYEI